jgi:hypothetical protein
MADLLTHVLVPYVLLTSIRWRVGFPSRRWVPVAMGGAAIPDLLKIRLLVPASLVQDALGIPFDYGVIGTLGGLLLVAGGITLLFRDSHRRIYGFLVFGGTSALLLDALRVSADGHAGYWLYPLWWRPPTHNVYVTSDPRVLLLVGALSLLVFAVDRRIVGDA